jgi:ferredoxin
VIVLATRVQAGSSRILKWNDRNKYYNDELSLTFLEEISLELVYWLEDAGYPAIIVPPTHVDPWRYDGDPKKHQQTLISLPHAAVEAGFGHARPQLSASYERIWPPVLLTAVLCSVEVECDRPMSEALCLGPECGRCLKACPGDVIGHWERDWEKCDTYRSPHGFAQLSDYLGRVIDEPDAKQKKAMLRSEDSFNLWQSILRGAGVITGCRRCADVCPVGADYEPMLKDALERIAESTPARRRASRRWRRPSPPRRTSARSIGSDVESNKRRRKNEKRHSKNCFARRCIARFPRAGRQRAEDRLPVHALRPGRRDRRRGARRLQPGAQDGRRQARRPADRDRVRRRHAQPRDRQAARRAAAEARPRQPDDRRDLLQRDARGMADHPGGQGVLHRAQLDADQHHRPGLQPALRLGRLAERGPSRGRRPLRQVEGLPQRLPDRAELSRRQGLHHRDSSAATAAPSRPRSTPS